MPFTAGDRVTIRGERWFVDETTVFADATLLHLTAADDRSGARRCRLIAPFDRPVAAVVTPRIRATTPRRWMRHLHSQLGDARAFGELRAPSRASIDILPFQLEPVLAVIRGQASRVLLADEVGLGKTVQAGLMLAELRLRGWCERALVVTPAGLRHQWADELRNRFDVGAAVMDAASLAALAASLPYDVNPWAVEAVAIASIDFLKQPEVLRGLATQLWDVLVVDEAHQATIASHRHDAIDALARRARHVWLLTATPHAGDDAAYRALCAIGKLSPKEPILLFRRTREAAGLRRSRRVHLLPVAPTPQGSALHRRLDTYAAQLWAVGRASGRRDLHLVAMVLAKRAFSSARALALSLERRLAGLGEVDAGPIQAALPFGVEEDASDDARMPLAPAFDRIDDERAALRQLLDAAQRAQSREPKMEALRRLIRRVREPLLIFTEYRDTVDAIRHTAGDLRQIATLHGGQTSHERLQSVDMFTSGAADLMIATDAGSEGLNLQGTCRVVINLELPWNPVRLEQRIGRVDRIGQSRTVHVINLIADGTAERGVLASLLRRIDRIRMSEIDVAACVIAGARARPPSVAPHSKSCTRTLDLSAEARSAAHRIADERRFSRATSGEQGVPVTVVTSGPPSLISFYRLRFVTRTGRLLEDQLLPIRLPLPHLQCRTRRNAAGALAVSLMDRFGSELLRHAHAHAGERARTIGLEAGGWIRAAAARERGLARSAKAGAVRSVQAGLFDARALKQKAAADRRDSSVQRDSDARAALLEDASSVRLAHTPELVMLLVICSPA